MTTSTTHRPRAPERRGKPRQRTPFRAARGPDTGERRPAAQGERNRPSAHAEPLRFQAPGVQAEATEQQRPDVDTGKAAMQEMRNPFLAPGA